MRGVFLAVGLMIAALGLLTFATPCDAQVTTYASGIDAAGPYTVATTTAPVWRSGPLGLLRWRAGRVVTSQTIQRTTPVTVMAPTVIYPQRWATGVYVSPAPAVIRGPTIYVPVE